MAPTMTGFGILLITSVTLAFIHTILSVDHYVPFIVLSRTNKWSVQKTASYVFVCGLGHVLSSVILGIFGILLSTGVSLPINIENIRGIIATYFLIAFGIAYTIFGVIKAVKNKPHTHKTADKFINASVGEVYEHKHEHEQAHTHDNERELAHFHTNEHGLEHEHSNEHELEHVNSNKHEHEHKHEYEHKHKHEHEHECIIAESDIAINESRAGRRKKYFKIDNAFWGLFVLMVLCPCEPLIPILMYPAAAYSALMLIVIVLSFAVCTIATMLMITFLGLKGIQFLKLEKIEMLERYSHLLAGITILVCGAAVLALPI